MKALQSAHILSLKISIDIQFEKKNLLFCIYFSIIFLLRIYLKNKKYFKNFAFYIKDIPNYMLKYLFTIFVMDNDVLTIQQIFIFFLDSNTYIHFKV